MRMRTTNSGPVIKTRIKKEQEMGDKNDLKSKAKKRRLLAGVQLEPFAVKQYKEDSQEQDHGRRVKYIKGYPYVALWLFFLLWNCVNGDKKSTECTPQLTNSDIPTGPSSSQPRYYIYPLPEKIWWIYPAAEENCPQEFTTRAANSGLGPVLDLRVGLFNTWHHSLHSSLYNRLKRSQHRTMNPEEASLFIIPYDNWLFYVMSTSKCNLGKYNNDDYFNVVAATVSKSQYYQRHDGRDHLYIHSAVSDIRARVSPSKKLHADFCQHCFKTCYWHQAKSHQTWISMPFPSMFHYHDAIRYIPWDPSRHAVRGVLVTYLGSVRRGGGKHVRTKIAALCAASAQCKSVIYAMKEANELTNSAAITPVNGVRHRKGTAPQVLAYYNSVFCLTPPGDDPTRRGLIDAILAGCIPVTFNPNTLLNQLPLHLTPAEAQGIGVYIPLDTVMQQDNLIAILSSIPSDIVAKKQCMIAQIAPRLQYSVPPVEYMQSHTDERQWDPPFADAVDVMLRNMSSLAAARIAYANHSILSRRSRRGNSDELDMFGHSHPSLRVDLSSSQEYFSVLYNMTTYLNASIVL